MKKLWFSGSRFPVSKIQGFRFFQFPYFLFSNFFLLFSFFSFAQQNSPYSRYGMGDLQSSDFSANKAMGGISSAYNSATNINFNNPASYASIKYTTFETGFFATSVKLKTSEKEDNIQNANLSYFAFAFPAAKKWTLTAGLLPFSRMDYQVERSGILSWDPNTTVDTLQSGNGSLYQLFLGNALQFGRFSAGLNVGYFFGKQNRDFKFNFSPASSYYLNERKNTAVTFSDIIWNAGIQYSDTLRKNLLFNVGINGRTAKDVATVTENLWERIAFDNSFIDTQYHDTVPGHTTLPAEYGIGFVLKRENHWQIGMQFSYGEWSKFTGGGGLMADNWLVGIGGEFIPDHQSRNYFRNIQYRAGFYFQNDYLKLRGKQLTEYAVTAGLGLPIRRTLSRVNFAFEFGQRGTTANGLIQENFFRAHIGITFNDVWFIKRKVE